MGIIANVINMFRLGMGAYLRPFFRKLHIVKPTGYKQEKPAL